MPVERFGDADRDIALAGEIGDQFRQIPLQVNAQREKVRQHQDLLGAGRCEIANGFAEVRRGFEKCGLIKVPRAFKGRPSRYSTHSFIS